MKIRELIGKIHGVMNYWCNNHIRLNKNNRKLPISIGNDWCYNASGKRRTRGGRNMATVFDVAAYILHEKGEMTTMKLQKLVYYAQAWSLAWDGKPIFENDFEAWANGPVCPELFHSHQGQYVVPRDFYGKEGNIKNLSGDEKDTIDAVLRDYGDKDSQWLSDLTHKERPWKEARQGISTGTRSNHIVSKETMQDYYGGLI